MFDYNLSDDLNTRLILKDLENERRKQSYYDHAGISSLYKTNITASGFMAANPNDQIRFGLENDLFPHLAT